MQNELVFSLRLSSSKILLAQIQIKFRVLEVLSLNFDLFGTLPLFAHFLYVK